MVHKTNLQGRNVQSGVLGQRRLTVIQSDESIRIDGQGQCHVEDILRACAHGWGVSFGKLKGKNENRWPVNLGPEKNPEIHIE